MYLFRFLKIFLLQKVMKPHLSFDLQSFKENFLPMLRKVGETKQHPPSRLNAYAYFDALVF